MTLVQTGVLRERYRIDAVAGTGGMGTVYRALDEETGQLCAVKLLSPDASAHTRERFLQEAVILAKVSHPAVVRYLDHGAEPQPFLVMEWVDGVSLAERLRSGGVTPGDALRLTQRLVLGLAAIHAAGVVHRDLKPRNIMLPNGSASDAKIVDFGVARAQTLGGRTNTGIRLGTPRYMAPEQIVSARRVDGRADVFSLGCVLFEVLTGRKAFRGEDEVALLARMVIEDAPRVRSVRSEVPAMLDELVFRLLARDFKRRPRASVELANEIGAVAEKIGVLDAAHPKDEAGVELDTAAPTPRELTFSTELTPLPPPSELPWATVGRDATCAELMAMLAPGAIVGLWGALGIGKSHVAQDVARRVWNVRSAVVCDLRDASDEDGVLRCVGGELGVLHAASSEDVAVAVRGRGDLVLVLDSCDGVSAAAIAVARSVVAEAPDASVLVVSREKPSLSRVVELGPLDADASVELLVARSRGTSDVVRDRDALDAIATHVQHNPLLLTLAASRASVIGIRAIAARLERPLDVLGTAKTPSYPVPLRAAAEAVWETLTTDERYVAGCCAAFPSSIRPAIAEAMANVATRGALEALEALRDKSLLRPAPRATFVMDPTLRELARSKLVIRDTSHATFAREVIARASVDEERARQGSGDALAELFAFEPDLLAAFEIAASTQNAELVLAAALALEPSLVARGPLERLASVMEHAARACDSLRDISPAPCARLFAARGRVATLRDAFDVASGAFEDALDLARVADQPDLVASVWLDLGVMHQARMDLAAAERCYMTVLDAHSGGASRVEARALGNLGALAHDRGELDVAYTYCVRAIAVAESIADARLLGVFLGNLAVTDRERGRPAAARQRFVLALRALEEGRERRLIGITLGNLGMLELEQERVAAARTAFEQSAELLAALGDARSEALAQARLAAALCASGDVTSADAALARAERLAARDARTLAVVKFFRAFPEAARAMTSSDDDAAAASRDRVRARIAAAGALLAGDDDARGALRILERWAKTVV